MSDGSVMRNAMGGKCGCLNCKPRNVTAPVATKKSKKGKKGQK